MKPIVLLLIGIGIGVFPSDSHAKKSPPPLPVLTLLAYDSLSAKGGFIQAIIPDFEAHCRCLVRVLTAGDGRQVLNRLELSAKRGKPVAQVVIGLDQHLWTQAKPWVEAWGDWRPAGFDQLDAQTRIGKPSEGFLPFDYGVFAWMVDRQALKESKLEAPRSLRDLLKPEWKRKLLLQDPRTSTPGLAFLLYTREVMGDDAWDYWAKLKSQWLAMSPGWDSAYGLFLKKEAPAVWSYTTSQAYHAENGDVEGRYQAVLFKEGQPLQIEGAALVKGALDAPGVRDRARSFMEYLISAKAQAHVPKTQWMLPARRGVKLPPGFASIPRPKKVFRIESDAAKVQADLKAWQTALAR